MRIRLKSSVANYDSHFIDQLKFLQPKVSIVNDVDDDPPPKNFTFIDFNVFCKGTMPPDLDARYGCNCKQKGLAIGCEYKTCSCLEDVARGEDGTPLGFPYHGTGEKHGCLRGIYLDERHPIYECNERCACPLNCKMRVVQHGRRIPLEIFKTRNRGWGNAYR